MDVGVFSSGCDHCGWVILGCVELKGEGEMPRMWNVVIPRSDYEIDDVWDTVGLRGTGATTSSSRTSFVPDHRTLDLEAMFSWKSPGLESTPVLSTRMAVCRHVRQRHHRGRHRHG